jgi:crotonobetainyl-CoA:carnitine CoA-transferase CaiB-like acyl-CoA transferase
MDLCFEHDRFALVIRRQCDINGSQNSFQGIKKMSDLVLKGYRVLDLTDEKGFLCGRMLGDLGADVIMIEPPSGSPSRKIGPFYKDIPDPEKSLFWFAYNANKKGITLNLQSKDGQNIFKKLVKGAHFVIESFSPGYMDSIDLGYSNLSQINPAVVLTSITSFGQRGPYSQYKSSDIVDIAMCGLMYLSGDPDRPPVRISFPQACLHGGAEAAVQTMVAHYYRETSGCGQWVDVSIQQASFMATFNAPLFWELNGVNLKRAGPWRTGLTSGVLQRQIWSCKDGYINMPIYGGALGARTNRLLTQWMDREGMSDDFLREIDWDTFDMGQVNQDVWSKIEERMEQFFMSHTKEELYHEALRLNIMIYPISTPKDIGENEQLASRNYWLPIEHPELEETITYPGTAVRASLTPMQVRERAPLIGEHNEEVYGELAFSKDDLVTLKQLGVI